MSDPGPRSLTEEGYDPASGKTLFQKAISREIETPLSKEILSGRVQDSAVLHVDDQNGKVSSGTGVPDQPTRYNRAIPELRMALLYRGLSLFSGRGHLS